MLKQLEMVLQSGQRSSEEILRDFFKIRNPTASNKALLEGILLNLGFEKHGGRWEYSPEIPKDQFVVVDVETTGLSFRQGARVIEIGMVEVVGDEIRSTFKTLVNPGQRIPYKITSITGITDEMLLTAPPFEIIAPDILEFIGNRYIVAHNFPFDFSFLKGEFGRLGIDLPERGICTLRIARKVLNLRRNNLDALARHFGFNFERGRHRAFGDAFVTAQIFIELKKRILSSTYHSDMISFYNECCGIQRENY